MSLRERTDNKLHVEEVRNRGNQTKIGDKEYKLSDLATPKNKIFDLLKNAEYNEFEDRVFGKKLTNREIEKTLDIKYIETSVPGFILPPGIYQISDINIMLKSLLPDDVKSKNNQ